MIPHPCFSKLLVIACNVIITTAFVPPLLLDTVLLALSLLHWARTWRGCSVICHVVIFFYCILLHW